MKIQKRVALIEFPVFQGVFPLVSGYLEGCVRQNPQIADCYEFQKYSFPINTQGIPEKMEEIEADIFGFSCYVWNMGLVKRLLPSLLSRCPNAIIVLGGPQAINKAARYLLPQHENVVVCNGEGEHTFMHLLEQLASSEVDFSKVNGLSFFRNGTLVTTPKQDRVRDMEGIPSPYLNGYLDPQEYVWAVIETNRGCPFTCTYCYWGAAVNAKVNSFSLERVLNEITWLSENGVLYVFIADANFGMLKRDVEIAEHLAKCREKNGFPLTVYFSSSKNTPERVTEITKTFDTAGLIATQPVSLQSINPDVLKNVKRDNIKTSSYTALQKVLNERNLSSFLEIIWPLPGETLKTFQDGLGQLCAMGADCFIVYPLLIINNVELENQREEFALVTINDPDPNSEAQIVVQTKDVDRNDYHEGLRFAWHVMSLYSLRGLRHVGRHLDSTGVMGFAELISSFSKFCIKSGGNQYIDYIQDTISASEQYKFSSSGGIIHIICYSAREEFDGLLLDFMRTLPCWDDPEARFLFEMDLLTRPHIYSGTPVIDKSDKLEFIRIVSVEENGYLLEMPVDYLHHVKNLTGLTLDRDRPYARVNYRRSQFPFMQGKSLDDNYAYCQDKLHKMTSILPLWTMPSAAEIPSPEFSSGQEVMA